MSLRDAKQAMSIHPTSGVPNRCPRNPSLVLSTIRQRNGAETHGLAVSMTLLLDSGLGMFGRQSDIHAAGKTCRDISTLVVRN